MVKVLSVPERHQLRIALETIKNPAKALLGPPNVEEAKEIVYRLTGRKLVTDSRRARLHRALDCVLDRSAAARGRDEEQDEEQYVIFRTGGSIGEHPWQSEPLSQVDARAKAKRMNAGLSPGEKQYYKIKYRVKKA